MMQPSGEKISDHKTIISQASTSSMPWKLSVTGLKEESRHKEQRGEKTIETREVSLWSP